jgi:hypothetical protein
MTSDGRIVAYDYGHTESFVNSTCHAISKKNDELLNYKLPKRLLKRIYSPIKGSTATATEATDKMARSKHGKTKV